MGKTVQVKKHFAFVGGLNTEASPLTFPANTWADGDNVIPDIDGSISLRTALDYEPGYALSTDSNTVSDEMNAAFVCGEWNSVGGNGSLRFAVVQRGATVSFYKNSGSTISPQVKPFVIDLTAYLASGNPNAAGLAPISLAPANGNLIICSRDTIPLLVQYNLVGDSITVSRLDLKIRDFAGVNDTLAVDNHPATLSAEHNYNLLNQGWLAAHITTYFTGATVYPSNAQQWTAGKDSSDNFSQALLDKQDFGTTPAAKGRFILNVFNRDRATASGVGGITTETETYRPTTCAFMAGRGWYSGIKSNTVGAWVLFSQVAELTDNLAKCYQDADPTSEFISDLVATDGGVIPIQDAGEIVKLVPFNNMMLVFADNGVWAVLGGMNGFAADSYEVRKLSSAGCMSGRSVVQTDQVVMYWSPQGIYAIGIDPNTGGVLCNSMTAVTIQSLYDSIPAIGKQNCVGIYHPFEYTVTWLFNDDDAQDGIVRRMKKNRMLIYDTRLRAFYTFSIASLVAHSPYVVDAFLCWDTKTFKFLTLHTADDVTFKVVFSNLDDTNVAPRKWREWYSKDNAGINFTGFLLPGYDLGGQDQGGDKFMQMLYVSVFMRRTETGTDVNDDAINPSSCMMQARWDFSDSGVGGRWSAPQEVYRHSQVWLADESSSAYDDGYPVVVTKNKVRGRGRAVQLKFTSMPDMDMQMLGWAATYLGNANV